MTVLVTGFWNIHGHWSKVIGDKLNDPELLETLKGIDILGMGELHADKKVSISGFVNVKQKIRKKIFSGPKIAGGIAVFVRQEVEHLVQVLENSNEDSIWIKLKKEKFGGKNDIYIGTYYVSPEGKKNKKKLIFFQHSMMKLHLIAKKVQYFSKVILTVELGLKMTSWSLISQT